MFSPKLQGKLFCLCQVVVIQPNNRRQEEYRLQNYSNLAPQTHTHQCIMQVPATNVN